MVAAGRAGKFSSPHHLKKILMAATPSINWRSLSSLSTNRMRKLEYATIFCASRLRLPPPNLRNTGVLKTVFSGLIPHRQKIGVSVLWRVDLTDALVL
jgi:hypothetical protein